MIMERKALINMVRDFDIVGLMLLEMLINLDLMKRILLTKSSMVKFT